jgi:hypothetical protein
MKKIRLHTVADVYWEAKERIREREECKELTNLR